MGAQNGKELDKSSRDADSFLHRNAMLQQLSRDQMYCQPRIQVGSGGQGSLKHQQQPQPKSSSRNAVSGRDKSRDSKLSHSLAAYAMREWRSSLTWLRFWWHRSSIVSFIHSKKTNNVIVLSVVFAMLLLLIISRNDSSQSTSSWCSSCSPPRI
jgi:hypothetical protein